MGQLINGTWHDVWYDIGESGEFVREQSQFRNFIGDEAYPAERNRYLLYISLACPWAHRTTIFRRLKSLESVIDICVVNWYMGENGWTFEPGQGVIPDPEFNSQYLYEIYQNTDEHFTGRVTVPVLWDKKSKTIVNNESSDIIRMFNSAFNTLTGNDADFYPKALRKEIDTINDTIYNQVNNGVYKSGFAMTQRAYDDNVEQLFAALDGLEERLSTNRYLVGDCLTEADWRLFTTLVRFDCVYATHFKCTLKRIIDYPNLWDYARHLYQMEGIANTIDWFHIMHHYYGSHAAINPTRIVPKRPKIDWSMPTVRGKEYFISELIQPKSQ